MRSHPTVPWATCLSRHIHVGPELAPSGLKTRLFTYPAILAPRKGPERRVDLRMVSSQRNAILSPPRAILRSTNRWEDFDG